MGVCNCSMFCCMLLYVHSSIAIILMGKSELIALLNLSSWCLVMVERLFLAMPRGCLQFVIVVFPDHTHLLFLKFIKRNIQTNIHKIKETTYKTYVRPLLDYSATVWDPWQKKYINQIEMIQHRAVRYIFNDYNVTNSVITPC